MKRYLAIAVGAGILAFAALPVVAAPGGFSGGSGSQGTMSMPQSSGSTTTGSGTALQRRTGPSLFRDESSTPGNSSSSDELNCLTPQHRAAGMQRPSDC